MTQRAGRDETALDASRPPDPASGPGAGAAPILLLHGQPGSARDWEAVQAQIGPRAETSAIDRPGWDGRTPAGGLEHSALAAVSALDAVGAQKATVVGLSFGGAVAARLAIAHPERVGALVLVSPAANMAAVQRIDRILAAPLAGYVGSAALLAGAGVALTSSWLRRRLEAAFALPDDYLRAAARRLRNPAVWEAFLVEQRALLRELPELDRRLGEITAPTTVVIGTADTIVPVKAGRKLATQIAGAELIEIDGGHHVLPAEHPRRVAEVILRTAAASETSARR